MSCGLCCPIFPGWVSGAPSAPGWAGVGGHPVPGRAPDSAAGTARDSGAGAPSARSIPGRELAWTVSFLGFSVAYWGYRLQPVTGGGTVITEQWRDLRTVPLFHWGPVIKLITGITDRVGTNESNMRVTLDRLKAAAER